MLNSKPASPLVTILTPTWNRRHLLPRLYQSLKAQEAPAGSFEWLVVDDGSTDGTAEWLETLVSDAPFPIRAIRQDNGGKHRALNLGFRAAQANWILIVDSDDWMTGSALVRIREIIQNINNKNVGIIFALHTNEGVIKNKFNQPTKYRKFFHWRNAQKLFDTTQIISSNAARGCRFPLEEGEKFMAEEWLYHKIDSEFDALFVNEAFVNAEYQPGGLSDRSRSLRIASPIGAMRVYQAQIKSDISSIYKIKSRINYFRFFFHSGSVSKFNKRYVDVFSFPAFIFGYLIYLIDRSWLLRGARD